MHWLKRVYLHMVSIALFCEAHCVYVMISLFMIKQIYPKDLIIVIVLIISDCLIFRDQ